MQIFSQAILPKNFSASAVACGLKKSGKLDLGLIYSSVPARACGLFTQNSIVAAPVVVSKKYLSQSAFTRAIIVNSGNANCFTGQAGMRDALTMSMLVSRELDIKPAECLVASTGIIGKRMDILKIQNSMPELTRRLAVDGISQVSSAIMTTDLVRKESTVSFSIGKDKVTVCGIAKGAGMIAPNMATMLCFITTDAAISAACLERSLRAAVSESFNCITVDGCMSTNDTVFLLANSSAGNKQICSGKDEAVFLSALKIVCLDLAKKIVADAEGATKFIEIHVSGAQTYLHAKTMALAIANSNLFKTAVYGQNPNFGRIVASVGACQLGVLEKDISVKVSPLDQKKIVVNVSVGKKKTKAVVYTSDLTPEYIKINAEYN